MTYATDIVQQYRIALRHLWNAHLWPAPRVSDWEPIGLLNGLKLPLFIALVMSQLDLRGPDPTAIFGDSFKVVPKISAGNVLGSLLVDVGFADRPGQCFTQMTGTFRPEDLSLTPIDFFDWDELNWRDFRYYRVRINRLNGHPESAGREGLVENTDVDVLWEPPGIVGLPPGIACK